MKKMLKKIMVLVVAATLFVMPASTALAASNPVVIFDDDDLTFITYQPDPYFLEGGHSLILADITNSDGWWDVPAGKYFRLQLTLDGNVSGTFRVLIVNSSGIVYDSVITGAFALCEVPPIPTNTRYQIWVTAYSHINIYGYGGALYN